MRVKTDCSSSRRRPKSSGSWTQRQRRISVRVFFNYYYYFNNLSMCWRIFDISSFCRVDMLILILLSHIITELQQTVECNELKHESTSLSVRCSPLISVSPLAIFTDILTRSSAEQPLHHARYLRGRHILTSRVNISAGTGPRRSAVWVNVSFRSFIGCDVVDGLHCHLWLRPWQIGMWQRAEICPAKRRAAPDTSACWWTFTAPDFCSELHAWLLK